MIHSKLAALTLILACSVTAQASYYAEEMLKSKPYWTRSKLQNKLKKGEILVSTTHVGTAKNGHWEMKGVGLSQVGLKQAWAYARDFEKLKKVPRHFKRVSYRPEEQLLSIRLTVLGIERELIAQVQEHEVSEKEKHLHWKNIDGLYKGLEGVLVVRQKTKKQTEISQFSRYAKKDLKVPGFVFRLLSEAVMKHVAEALRDDLETNEGE